uniref:Uncharacterized protein n=1 Tax=viral metagenome TaxID=1070528 RepID=A0A6C0I0S7_9ZZZZ
MFTTFIKPKYNKIYNQIYKANKHKELLSVSKTNNNIKNMPKYSKCPRVHCYYSTPFNYVLKMQNVQKRHYYVNPQKPPDDDFILYILVGVSFMIYRTINNSPPPTQI